MSVEAGAVRGGGDPRRGAATRARVGIFARASRAAAEDRFFRVPRTTRRTSEGDVELPILYYDASNVVALFDAERAGVEAVLDGTGLEPAIVVRGRPVVALSFYEYRHTSVGVYNEVGTAIFVVRRGERRPALGWADLYVPPRRRTIGAYVADLPVTTKAADAAGREIWGYPKFVTDISFRMHGRDVDTRVMDPSGGAIVTLAGRMGPGVPAPPLSLMTYTRLDGALVRTHVDVRGAVTVRAPGTVRLAVGPSRHPMAERLRALGIASAAPRLLMCTDRFQSKLHEGMRVG